MLRIAGLPADTVAALRCPESRRWADRTLAETSRLREDGARLGDRLHAVVSGIEDPAARRRLLKLRRDVFNARLPRDPATELALVAEADARLGRDLAAWLEDRARLAEDLAAGADLLGAELTASRAALRRIAAEERLRDGLLLASPSLDAQLDAYLRTPPERADKRNRKVERSLLAYLYRTACKTSPFSTFTGVALGEFTDDAGMAGTEGRGRAARELRVADEWTSHPRLNVLALERIAEAVLADPARRADLPVAPASGWIRDENRVRYVRRWITAGDDDAAVTFDSVKDRLFFLRRSGALERMLTLFEERGEPRYGELAGWLAADQGATEEEAGQYLATLLDLGMLQVPSLHAQVHDVDPLGKFQRSLRALGRPWADRTADALETPAACLRGFPEAGPARRRELLEELRASLHAVQRELGAERTRVPQTVLYEDVTAPPVRTGRDGWEGPVFEPLRAVEETLPAFDLTLTQRIMLKGFFLARYGKGGRCTDLQKLVHDFHEDFFDQYMSFTAGKQRFDERGRYVPEENWLNLPQISALDSARRTFAAGMRAIWEVGGAGAGATAGDPGEVVLPAELLEAVAGELAPVRPALALYSHHIQVAEQGDGDDPLVVLNRSFGGLSFPFSRFTHCLDSDGDGSGEPFSERLRDRARQLEPEGAVFAEVTGGQVTSNLNLHARLTDHEIVCPGETSPVPAHQQLHLDDLFIEHDPVADRLVLRSARLGREVVPVYLGYLVPLALPEIPRTLLLLSPSAMASLDVWGGVPESEADAGVTRRPRVRAGRVVLARRSWSAPASALPLRGPEDSDADWFRGWHRWRIAQELPDRVFATVSQGGARGATAAKPQYVDFDSALSLAAFEALLRTDKARVVLQEMLPADDQLHAGSGRGAHVAELSVETVTAPAPPAPSARSGQAPEPALAGAGLPAAAGHAPETAEAAEAAESKDRT
ncbi:lantibiotic dehydratase [Streptomyces sodiiphilus]